jgi:hypothetical protein
MINTDILDGRPLMITREGYNQLVQAKLKELTCPCWRCQAKRMNLFPTCGRDQQQPRLLGPGMMW